MDLLINNGRPPNWAPPEGKPTIKGPQERSRTHNFHEPGALLHAPPPLSSLSLPFGSPKGCVGSRTTPPLHAVVLQEFWIWSKLIYFHNLGQIRDPEVIVNHRTCTSTMRCCTCGTGVVAPDLHDLEVGYSASSLTLVRENNPHIWSTGVCHLIPVNRYSNTNR
jgi:hypothetical protein